MQYGFTPQDEAFRADVRTFLSENLPQDIAYKVRCGQRLVKDDYIRWQKILATRDWLAVGWPAKFGGPGFTATQRYIFEQESGALPCPRLKQFGIGMIGPVLYTFGNEEQQQRFLPGILESRDWWCQGFSEPGAGSDLAALKTSAVLEGDEYVVNGQKVWTTHAHWADWIFCLVRTDTTVKQQVGITFLMIDMKTPGITVRAIQSMDGEHEFNEVFFDDVRVPVANRIGEQDKGWTYAKFLLGHERFNMSNAARTRRQLGELRSLAANTDHINQRERDRIAARLAALDVQLTALDLMELRMLSAINAGRDLGADASKLKLRGSDIAQDISRLRLEIVGSGALTLDQDWLEGQGDAPFGDDGSAGALAEWLNLRKLSIWGGSSEIQRTILAKSLLELKG